MQQVLRRDVGPVMQLAWVVRDLEAAIDHWTRVMRVGPFFLFEHVPFSEMVFRGAPSPVDMSAAIAYSGELQIELIEQHNAAASVYTEFTRAGRTGMHHLAVMTDAMPASTERLAADGLVLVQQGQAAQGMRFAYFETNAEPGCLLELIERSPGIEEVFGWMRASARTWDGRQPIARFA